jgi:hypothetical protein
MSADLPLFLIDLQGPAVETHQGHLVQLLRLCSDRVPDPGGFLVSQCNCPVSRYREFTDAVLGRGGESEVAEHIAETDVKPVGEGLKPRVQRLARQGRQADREGPRKRHDVVDALRCLPILVVIFRDSKASSSSSAALLRCNVVLDPVRRGSYPWTWPSDT